MYAELLVVLSHLIVLHCMLRKLAAVLSAPLHYGVLQSRKLQNYSVSVKTIPQINLNGVIVVQFNNSYKSVCT